MDVTQVQDIEAIEQQLEKLMPKTQTRAAVTYPLAAYGFYFTSEQIAQQLAILGSLIFLDGPLPFGDLLALLTGVVVLGVAATGLFYYSYNVGLYMNSWYGATVYSNSSRAIADSQVIADAARNGFRHFLVQLAWEPGGGIKMPVPIPREGAIFYLQQRANVFSVTHAFAYDVALYATPNGFLPVTHNNPHTSKGNLNLPHVHPNYFGDMSRLSEEFGHSFYTHIPIPFI